jgi:hypothetical protein
MLLYTTIETFIVSVSKAKEFLLKSGLQVFSALAIFSDYEPESI